jgi:hypothetical protein
VRHDIAAIVTLVFMIGLIVGLDVVHLRDRLTLRLTVNVSIAIVDGALCLGLSHLL